MQLFTKKFNCSVQNIHSAPKVSAIVNQQFFGEKIIPLVVYIVKKPKNNPHLPQTLNLHLLLQISLTLCTF